MHTRLPKRVWLRLLLAVSVVALVVWLWVQFPVGDSVSVFRHWLQSLGYPGVLAFAALYVFVTVVLGPASALTLTAGLVYGFWGLPLVVASATAAAGVAFLLGRYFLSQRVNRWIERNQRLLALNQAVSMEGWKVVMLLRLSPLIPYGLQNYLFSVTRIAFVPYLLATAIGITPATTLYVYIGRLGQSFTGAGYWQWLLVVVGLLATLWVAWVIGRRASAVLQTMTPQD
ncbi:MAG: TVP38/TMEM64 family protein [Granulosicoccus sp.]